MWLLGSGKPAAGNWGSTRFTGTYKRWANLLVWGSVAALGVGVLNSIRLTFIPTTLWALATYIVMIAAGGGLMFRSLGDYDDKPGNGAD